MQTASSLVALQLDFFLSSTSGATDSLRKRREEKRRDNQYRKDKQSGTKQSKGLPQVSEAVKRKTSEKNKMFP